MPLIICPDCSKQISDQAPTCIHCGCPIRSSAGPALSAQPANQGQDVDREMWTGGPSQKSELVFYVIMGLFFWLVVPLLMILVRYLTLRCTHYSFSNQRLTIKRGILSRSTEEIELFRVKDIGMEEPFLLRIFGLGNVLVIEADATAPAMVLVAIEHPEKVRLLLREQVMSSRSRRRTVTMEAI